MGLLDDGESLRIKTNRRPKDRPQRKSRASQRRQGGFYKVNLLSREEHKYQMIKLMRSGRTLRETKALIRAASEASEPEFLRETDARDLLSLEGGLHMIGKMNRAQARDWMRIKFAPRRLPGVDRNEQIAAFATGWRGRLPVNWKRDGNLIRRGRPNYPDPGSSAGKIGRTRVIGAKRVLNEFKTLILNLANLQGKAGKGNLPALREAYKSFRIGVQQDIGP